MSSPSGLFTIFLVAALVVTATVAQPPESPRAFFVFGDSLVDNGNNNFLLTMARADSPPYGIDFPSHTPTGRFSNGLNVADLISEMLGAPYTLPYLSPELNEQNLLVGANFASAGVGILPDTGFQFANIVNIGQQLNYFQDYQQRLSTLIGSKESQKLVNNAIVLITIGGNDYVNNYFLAPLTPRRAQFTLPDYTTFLISEYKKILQRLYDLGARRVLVTGMGPLGCTPAERSSRSSDGNCAKEPQEAARLFNQQLIQMIKELNQQFKTNGFVAANAVEQQNDFVKDPQAFGFATSKIACCGQGPYRGIGLCTRFSVICEDRTQYVWWDPFHPTERANRLIAQTMFDGAEKYMNPMNLSTIMAMDSRKIH